MMKIPAFVNNVRSSALKKSQRFSFYTLHFELEGAPRFWEILATEKHRQGLLLFNTDSQEFILSKKFRPALLSRHGGVESEELSPEGLSLPTGGCVMTELFSCITSSPSSTRCIVDEVRREIGLELDEGLLEKVSSFRMWGERYHLYYAPVNCKVPSSSPNIALLSKTNLAEFVQQSDFLSSDLVLALEWWKWHKRDDVSGC
ncbi:hypothetical protein ACHWQZ_G009057 [Mnemiopsis leidyi]